MGIDSRVLADRTGTLAGAARITERLETREGGDFPLIQRNFSTPPANHPFSTQGVTVYNNE